MVTVTINKKNIEIEDDFICSITQQIMLNPVVTADGHTYEREAITRWLQEHNTSPLTGAKLANKQLQPNHFAKRLISKLLDKYPSLRTSEHVYAPQQVLVTRCCKHDNADELMLLLAEDSQLISKVFIECDGRTLWHFAAYYQSSQIVGNLLDRVNEEERHRFLLQVDSHGITPLHQALLTSKEEPLVWEYLLRALEGQEDKIAAFPENTDLPESTILLLNHYASIAMKLDDLRFFVLLQRLGAQISNPFCVQNKRSLLHVGMLHQAYATMDYCISAQLLPIDVRDREGYSPLHFGVKESKIDSVKWLLTHHEPDVNHRLKDYFRRCREGYTPLATAINASIDVRIRLVDLLLNHEANPNLELTPNPLFCRGLTPLHYACMKGSLEVVQRLITAGADIADGFVCTSGFRAASGMTADSDIVNILALKRGSTALHIAWEYKHIDILRYLISVDGAPIDCADSRGNTLLHYFAAEGDETTMLLLLQKGAPYQYPNDEGETPVDIIKRHHAEFLPRWLQAIYAYTQKQQLSWQERLNTLAEKVEKLEQLHQAQVEQAKKILQDPHCQQTLYAPKNHLLQHFFLANTPEIEPLMKKIKNEKLAVQNKLVAACASGDLNRVIYCHKEKGALLELPDQNGEYPLVSACRTLHFDIMDYIHTMTNDSIDCWDKVIITDVPSIEDQIQNLASNMYITGGAIVTNKTTFKELSIAISLVKEMFPYDKSTSSRLLHNWSEAVKAKGVYNLSFDSYDDVLSGILLTETSNSNRKSIFNKFERQLQVEKQVKEYRQQLINYITQCLDTLKIHFTRIKQYEARMNRAQQCTHYRQPSPFCS